MGRRIAVLGAGPMGLSAAYQLLLEGHQPILFEAGDQVGGMTASFDFNGLVIERFYHFHCSSDQAFLTLLDELGISHRMRWSETKMGYWYQDRLQEWGNPIALFKFKGLGLFAKLRYGAHAFLSVKRDDWWRLDKLEASAWIRRWVGAEAWEVLWRRLFEYKFYEYSDQLSAAWIWSRIRRVGRSRYNLLQEKLGYLEGGSSDLLNALEAEINLRGGIIRLNSAIETVAIKDGRICGVQVNGNFEAFDKVISTIPLPYVPKIIPGLPKDVLLKYCSFKNIAVVCVIVKLKKPVSENFWLNINDPDMEIPGLVEYSNLRPLDWHVIYVPFYMPSEHYLFSEPDSAFQEKVRSYIKKINPSIEDSDFIDTHTSRYRHAQPICTPGFLDELPPVASSIAGLWIADTSYYYPEDRGISESVDFGRRMARMAVAQG